MPSKWRKVLVIFLLLGETITYHVMFADISV